MCFIILLAVSATIGEALSPNSVSLAVPDNYLCANSILEVKEHTPYFVAGYIPPQSWQICKKECNIEIANNQTTKRKISCNFEWMSISINFDERSIEKLTEISYILFKQLLVNSSQYLARRMTYQQTKYPMFRFNPTIISRNEFLYNQFTVSLTNLSPFIPHIEQISYNYSNLVNNNPQIVSKFIHLFKLITTITLIYSIFQLKTCIKKSHMIFISLLIFYTSNDFFDIQATSPLELYFKSSGNDSFPCSSNQPCNSLQAPKFINNFNNVSSELQLNLIDIITISSSLQINKSQPHVITNSPITNSQNANIILEKNGNFEINGEITWFKRLNFIVNNNNQVDYIIYGNSNSSIIEIIDCQLKMLNNEQNYSISTGLVQMKYGYLNIHNLRVKDIKITKNNIIKIDQGLEQVKIIGCNFENVILPQKIESSVIDGQLNKISKGIIILNSTFANCSFKGSSKKEDQKAINIKIWQEREQLIINNQNINDIELELEQERNEQYDQLDKNKQLNVEKGQIFSRFNSFIKRSWNNIFSQQEEGQLCLQIMDKDVQFEQETNQINLQIFVVSKPNEFGYSNTHIYQTEHNYSQRIIYYIPQYKNQVKHVMIMNQNQTNVQLKGSIEILGKGAEITIICLKGIILDNFTSKKINKINFKIIKDRVIKQEGNKIEIKNKVNFENANFIQFIAHQIQINGQISVLEGDIKIQAGVQQGIEINENNYSIDILNESIIEARNIHFQTIDDKSSIFINQSQIIAQESLILQSGFKTTIGSRSLIYSYKGDIIMKNEDNLYIVEQSFIESKHNIFINVTNESRIFGGSMLKSGNDIGIQANFVQICGMKTMTDKELSKVHNLTDKHNHILQSTPDGKSSIIIAGRNINISVPRSGNYLVGLITLYNHHIVANGNIEMNGRIFENFGPYETQRGQIIERYPGLSIIKGNNIKLNISEMIHNLGKHVLIKSINNFTLLSDNQIIIDNMVQIQTSNKDIYIKVKRFLLINNESIINSGNDINIEVEMDFGIRRGSQLISKQNINIKSSFFDICNGISLIDSRLSQIVNFSTLNDYIQFTTPEMKSLKIIATGNISIITPQHEKNNSGLVFLQNYQLFSLNKIEILGNVLYNIGTNFWPKNQSSQRNNNQTLYNLVNRHRRQIKQKNNNESLLICNNSQFNFTSIIMEGEVFIIETKERIEKERIENEKIKKDRIEKEKMERERNEKLEKEKIEKVKQEQKRIKLEKEMQERLERERIQRLQREKKEKEEELERQRKQRERIEQQRLEMERIEQLRQKEIEQHLQLVNNYRNFVLGPQAQLETRPLEWQPYKRTKDRGKAIVDGWWHCEFWFIDDGTYDHFGFFPLSTHTKRPWEGDQKAQIRPDKKKFLNGYAHNRPLAKTNAQDARLRLAVDTQRANHNEIRYHLDHHDCRHYAWELLHASYLECVRLYQLALPHLSPGEQCLCKDARKY